MWWSLRNLVSFLSFWIPRGKKVLDYLILHWQFPRIALGLTSWARLARLSTLAPKETCAKSDQFVFSFIRIRSDRNNRSHAQCQCLIGILANARRLDLLIVPMVGRHSTKDFSFWRPYTSDICTWGYNRIAYIAPPPNLFWYIEHRAYTNYKS